MTSLNIEILLIGFNEKTSLIKNHILILCMHKCLNRRNKPVNIDFLFHSQVFARQAFVFHGMP